MNPEAPSIPALAAVIATCALLAPPCDGAGEPAAPIPAPAAAQAVPADASDAATDANFVPAPQAGDELSLLCLADVGVEPAAFMRAISPLYDGSMSEVHAILVLVRGALIYEDYFRGNTDWIDFDHGLARVPGAEDQWLPGDLHYVASVAKSVTSLVAGIAFAELGWSLEDPLAPRLASAPWLLAGDKSGITARHLLTMTSGVKWDEWTGGSHVENWNAPERFRHFAGLPMEAPPGERWSYNSVAPSVLLLAIDAHVEHGVREYADERLFSQLGIDNYRWGPFEGDIPDGGTRLYMRARDMAKIGLLILNRGEWRGRQIVPRDYMIAATSPQVSTAPANDHQYGYLMWVRRLQFEGSDPVQYIAVEGDGGNQINVFPDRDLVIVTLGGSYGEFPVYEAQGQRLLRRLVPLFLPRADAP